MINKIVTSFQSMTHDLYSWRRYSRHSAFSCRSPRRSPGTFTAQRAGLYSFAFTAYSDIVTAGLRLYHMVQLTKNGEAMTGVWEDNREDAEDSATQTLLLHLQPGDQVYVELMSGRYICNDHNQHNTFSGYMLYMF